jgi:rod shape-determining protein MreD
MKGIVMPRWATTILFSIFLILLQTTIIRFLSVESISPDILLIWIVMLGIRDGHITGMTAGFLIGLVLDLLSGTDGMLGLTALSKTAAGFISGYFYNENKTYQTLGSYQFLLILAAGTLVHNLIYFIIFLQGSGIRWWDTILFYGIPSLLYTVAVGVLPMFVVARKHLI